MTVIRRTAGPRLVRSHGQVVTSSMMPLRKPAVPVNPAAKSPALRELIQFRADLMAGALDLARDQVMANTAVLQALVSADDWEALAAIVTDYGNASAARYAQAVQLQIQLVGKVAERLAVGG